MKPTFLSYDKPPITAMIQIENTCDAIEMIKASLKAGADAVGVQTCVLKSEFQNTENYKKIFASAEGKPIYATHYRTKNNEGKSDDEIANRLLQLADCGATLCDVMGDLFDKQQYELTTDEAAICKQKELIKQLHEKGAEVLMSSHVRKFIPAEKVLEIALEHQKRGADISKIVTKAESTEEEIENLRIITLLKEKLEIPFLFLAGGQCKTIRRFGPMLGSCMFLGVAYHHPLSTKAQPEVAKLKAIRDNYDF